MIQVGSIALASSATCFGSLTAAVGSLMADAKVGDKTSREAATLCALISIRFQIAALVLAFFAGRSLL